MTSRALVLVICAACADEATAPVDPGPSALERVWSESIRPGDVIVVVPGTGTHTGVGVVIDDAVAPGVVPELDARERITSVDPIEGAIAAAQRAGIPGVDLEAGAVRFGLWGAGIAKTPEFTYVSADGLRIRFEVVGGTSVCGDGGIPENLVNYTTANAELDARDLYRRTQAWLGDGADRNVVLVSHSWGGVVAEYFAQHLAGFERAHEPWPGARPAFVVAAGVPPLVPGGFAPAGPGFRTVASTDEDVEAALPLYEVDRPDDPAHSFDPTSGGGGHHYIIMVGESYRGWYGITTDELACDGVEGICPPR